MSKYSGEQMGLWKKDRIIILQVREGGERDERRMKEEGVKRRKNVKEGMREGLNKPRD